MTEEIMNERVNQIMDEYSQLPQMKNYDLTLEAIGYSGDVKTTLKRGDITFEKIIAFSDDLKWISDTFYYPSTIYLQSKDIALDGLKMAYFDEFGALVTEREGRDHPRTIERFKINPAQREEIKEKLKERFGNKLKCQLPE